jgi:nitronate monooxygenase
VERSQNRAYRVRRNEAAEKVLELEEKGTTMLELLPYIGGERYKEVLFGDDVEAGVVACGPVAGLIEDIVSVKEIIDRIIGQAKDIVERLHSS